MRGRTGQARDSAGRRCYPDPMGKRRAKHPFEDNPVIDGFLAWMDDPRDNSRSRHWIWCSTHWNMPASTPGSARLSGPTGNAYL